jgi:hypothetical protein
MRTDRQQEIIEIINSKIETENNNLKFANKQIDILDNAREPYLQAIYKIDSDVFSEIEAVNTTMIDVQSKYQDRVNSGCRTDLYWRFTGIGTVGFGTGISFNSYTCTKASPVGLGTTAGDYLTSAGVAYSTTPGLQEDNLYGIKIYDEPYSQDVVNSYVGSFIGTVGAASTVLTVMNPLYSGGLDSIKIGQLVVCDKQGVFPSGSNEIVGIGTAIANLTNTDPGITTNKSLVKTLILKDSTAAGAYAPESDNTFVNFTVLIDPDEIKDVGIPFGSNPYVPQTIKMMTSETIGTGVSVFYDNSGISSASKSWNQFLNGLQDPDDLRSGKIVTEPQVGADKIYYKVGFADKPYKGGSPAVEGDTAFNFPGFEFPDEASVSALPSCASTITSAITNAESVRDAKEAQFSSGISTVNIKLELSNQIRADLNELNIRIWGYRGQIGQVSSNINTYNQRTAALGKDYVSKLING